MEPPIWHLRAWLRLAWRRCRDLMGVVRRDRTLWTVFVTLLAIDAAWILWFGVAKVLYNAEIYKKLYELRELRIVTEGGYPEIYNYVKTGVLVVLLGGLSLRTRQLVYVGLTILFAVALIDDSCALHEEWGAYLVKRYHIEEGFGVRDQDIGEVITWALLGAATIPLVLVGLVLSARKHVINGAALLLAFGVLMFCAIFVDQLYHSFGYVFFGSGILLDMLEDGGEMLVITVALLMTAALVRHGAEVGMLNGKSLDLPGMRS